MAKMQMLRTIVNDRLNAAVDEIFGVFERTISQYEEEIHRQQKLLDLVYRPEIKLPKSDSLSTYDEEIPTQQLESSPSLVQEVMGSLQLSTYEGQVPLEQQGRSPSLGQETSGPPQVKEEQKDFSIHLVEEQSEGLEEADVVQMIFSPVPVKTEPDIENPVSSSTTQTHGVEARPPPALLGSLTEPIKTDPVGVDGSKLHCSGSQAQDGYNRKEAFGHQSGLNIKRICGAKGLSGSSSKMIKISAEPLQSPKPSVPSEPSCKVCGKAFPNKVSLNRHVSVHTNDCGLCGKHLETGESFKIHRQTHSTCQFCGKVFPCMANLERHIITHTGEKLFSCAVCGKGFSQKGVLKTHMLTHTEEKPFNCVVCGKRFSQKALLKMHMVTHTSERPFSCTVCFKKFSRKAVLRRHMKIHTLEKPYHCKVCGFSFVDYENFSSHNCQSGELDCQLPLLGLGFQLDFPMVTDIDGY